LGYPSNFNRCWALGGVVKLIKLGRNFNEVELCCNCGCGYGVVNPELLLAIQQLRDKLNKPITVTSWCRCHSHNTNIGGHQNSDHLYGKAIDITVGHMGPYDLAAKAMEIKTLDNGGIGIYPSKNFVHLDVGSRSRWIK
jgi:uncharacterized protein YcbK (DUF882 family)